VPPDIPKEVVEKSSDASDQSASSTPAVDYGDLTQDPGAVPPSGQDESANLTNLQIISSPDPDDPNADSADPSTAFNTPASNGVVAAQVAQNALDLGVVLSNDPLAQTATDQTATDQTATDQGTSTDTAAQKPAPSDSTDPKSAAGQDSDQDSPDASQDSPEPSSNENFSLSLGAAAFLVPDSADQEPVAVIDSVFTPENVSPGQEWNAVAGEEPAPTGGAESIEGSPEPNDVATNEPSVDYDSGGSSFEGSGFEGSGESGFDHSGPAEPEESSSAEPTDGNTDGN
jgi:hypothetical protein